MKLTLKKLKSWNACEEGIKWFTSQTETDAVKVIKKLLSEDRFHWVNWTIPQALTKKNKISYAIYAASLVLKIYEDKYPNDDRPQKAIQAAKAYLKNPTKENKNAAANAANAAYAANAAAYAANAANAAANAATCAAELKPKIINYGLKLLKGQK